MIVANDTIRVWKENIPAHWQVLPLKYTITYNDDKLTDQTDENFEFDYVDIGSVTYGKGIETFQHMKFSDAPSRARRIVKPKDVIMSTVRTYLKATAEIEEHNNPIIVSTGFMVMRARNGVMLPDFLGYIAQSDGLVSEIECQSYGASYPAINAEEIAGLSIPLPPIPEQQAIVRYLDAKCAAIDEAIERHKKIIEKLEEYKRSSIIKAVNGDISDNTKASGIAWMPTVPSHWGVVPMRFALTQRKNKNEGLVEKNLLTLSYGKIKRKDIETNEGLLPSSFEGYNIIEAGDIVLRLMDLQNDKHSLRTGLVTERGIITSAYVTVIPTEGFDPAYCRYLLHAYDLMKVFYSMGEGVRQGLTYDDLSRTLLIPKPPIDEQSKIASNIIKMEGSVDASIGKQNAMLEKLEEYRKSIIYNAVTGKIDCRTETQP